MGTPVLVLTDIPWEVFDPVTQSGERGKSVPARSPHKVKGLARDNLQLIIDVLRRNNFNLILLDQPAGRI